MSAVGVEAQIAEALLARLNALTLSPALQVAWPGRPFPAPPATDKPDTYLRASLLRAGAQGIGISAWNDYPGILQVDVMDKPDNGEIEPLDVACSVADWFARGTLLPNGSVQVRVDDPPAIGKSMPNGDGYSFIPVSIRYHCFKR